MKTRLTIKHSAVGSSVRDNNGNVVPFDHGNARDRADVAKIVCNMLGMNPFDVPAAVGK